MLVARWSFKAAKAEYAEQAAEETLFLYLPRLLVIYEEILKDLENKLEQKGFTNDEINIHTKDFREDLGEYLGVVKQVEEWPRTQSDMS